MCSACTEYRVQRCHFLFLVYFSGGEALQKAGEKLASLAQDLAG